MIKINLVAVGKLKENYLSEAVEEYAKRISRYASFNIIEVPERPDGGDIPSLLAEEGKGILKKVKGYSVLLDLQGEELSSTDLASLVGERAAHGTSEFTFIIGGSRGVSAEVKNRAESIVSFGKVTYPHQLMRVILAEQIYRLMTILNNVSYHK